MKQLLFLQLILILNSCKNDSSNHSLNGYKDGILIEYLNKDRTTEVKPSKADIIRHVTYKNGQPIGKIIETDLPQQSRYEFQLVSGPYQENTSRPKDTYTGVKLFLEYPDSTKINNWIYFDSNGEIDFEKLFLTAYDEISTDKRFDKAYFLKTQNGLLYDTIFKQLHQNSDKYQEVVPVIIEACQKFKSDPILYWSLICDLTKQQLLKL
ncbi:hypothetical protein G9H61_10740 [Aquirufa ecclesiirivi]|uniref:DUF4369 domain-containing protein n=1 Tax=Aquirufa ecclesiirivi TaxID=2715124 RepID=A0ABT4JI18_9BACT|nr:hypothetical protein [Aquirufa ecclesiirivi]MCZ2475927.1 hypothetical protein [Aquirufa ecclesiirivi]